MAADPAMIARLRLGARLRGMREAAGVTGGKAAAAIMSSASKVSRMESGHVGIRRDDVAVLLDLYGVPGAARAEPLRLACEAGSPGYWDRLADQVPPGARHYLALEAAASTIITYDAQAVPALLQSPAYAHALCSANRSRATWRGMPLQVMHGRRGLMTVAEPPFVWALIGEPALRRVPGEDPRVLADQLTHLLLHASSRRATIQLVPGSAPAQLDAPGSLTLLRFAEPDLPDVVVLEQATGSVVLERRSDVSQYLELALQIAIQAADPPSSAKAITAARETLTGETSHAGEGTRNREQQQQPGDGQPGPRL